MDSVLDIPRGYHEWLMRSDAVVGGAQVRSLPIRKDDEVQIVRGKHAKEAVSKVTSPCSFFQSMSVIHP